MKVIALSGYKGSGKDTIALLLSKYGYIRTSFADPIKDLVSQKYRIPRSFCDDPERKELHLLEYKVDPQDNFSRMITQFMLGELPLFDGSRYWSPRALCILEGSIARSVSSEYWVKRAMEQIDFHPFSVISDLRYKSEVKQLRDKYGSSLLVVRINRFEKSESVDPSERDLDDFQFDIVIENKGTLEELEEKVKVLV
jgi:hypothetical protein